MRTRNHILDSTLRDPWAIAGSIFPLLMLIVGIAALFITDLQRNALEMNAVNRLEAPSMAHYLGTDQFGRDVLARIVYSTRPYLLVALAAVVICTVVGSILAAVPNLSNRERATAGPVLRVLSLGPLLSLPFAELAPTPVSLMVISSAGGFGTAATNIIVVALLSAPLSAMTYRLFAHHRNDKAKEKAAIVVILGLLATISATAILESGPSNLGIGYPPPLGGWGSLGAGTQYITEGPWILIAAGGALTLALASLIALSIAIGRFWKRIEAEESTSPTLPASPLLEPVSTR